MRNNIKKVLSFVLVLVMVLGMIPFAASANEAQTASASTLPSSMDGLNISYPYNTETVKQTSSVPSRFSALTFESARNEVESAQMILSPNFDISSFELTMGSLKNENGNIIPSWAFEVSVQHYVSIEGAGNGANYSSNYGMYSPKTGDKVENGMYPDALIPMDAAITAGENKISAGKNGGLWVNLDVQDAAPGTYTGFASLNVNGTDMQIPVSVRIYDVAVPEEVHQKTGILIWWDQLQAGEGYIDRALADTYFDYIVSKRLSPMDAWNRNRYDDAMAEYAASYLAIAPEISAYCLPHTRNSDGTVNEEALRTTLTIMINKNLEVAASGSDADLFKKAYFYIYDEPETSSEYKIANTITATLESVKNELAPMLADYPAIQESFMNLKHVVTAPNPTDKTYSKLGTWPSYNFANDNFGDTPLTGDSYIYCPQYQWLNTESQREKYANEEELWWYGCCHPVQPYPTYHINSPLISARAVNWMMQDYGISGYVYSSVNYWGNYENGNIVQMDYWNKYTSGTPGDMILVYPGSAYGVYGPIGTIRLENIREGNEDYEYLWLLKNEYGISDISAYTKGLYEGVIVTGVYDGHTVDPDGDGNTDAVTIHYNNRKALLTKLEQLNVAENGATQIAPGQEGFVRGEAFTAGVNFQVDLDQTKTAVGLSMDYKITDGEKIGVALLSDWSNFYGYYNLYAEGVKTDYEGVYVQKLDDGYVRVIFELATLTVTNASPTPNLDLLFVRGSNTSASGYIDNVQLLDEIPEIETPVGYRGEEIVAGKSMSVMLPEAAAYDVVTFDMIVPAEGGENEIGFCLYQGGSDYLGYFYLEKTGLERNYAGVSAEQLDDGYWRVTLDVDQITDSARIHGTPEIFDRIYIRNHTTGGYIDNVQCYFDEPEEPEAPQEIFDGSEFVAGAGVTISLDNSQSVTRVSFDYKLTSEGHMNVALLPDWSNYFGYFKLDANGEVGDYKGVTTQKIENGYIRVYIDMAEVNYIAGTPSDVITMIYVRGNYTTANGEITNIRLNSSACEPLRGNALTPGVNQSIDLDATEEIGIISFDYKLIDDGKIGMALLPNWSTYFGYYHFYANGPETKYPGVTVEVLEDGYVHVTMELDALNKKSGDPSKIIDFIYIRGSYTTANGYIDNVQYVLKKDMPRGTALTPGENQSIDLDATEEITSVSFDYKLTGGTKFSLALLPNWTSYFGYYGFVASGPEGVYPGVTAETLEDGYIRVTFNMAELTYKAGDPSCLIDFLFINGNYSNAEGYIDNVQYTLGCSHNYESVVTDPSFTAGGYTTYTCTKCGNSYVDNATDAYSFDVLWNIALADDIRANFHLTVDSRLNDVQIMVNGVPAELNMVDGKYVIIVNVAAAQMTDEISIQVISSEAESEVRTYSIRQYAEYILTNSDDDNTKLLVQRMLNYGAAAQTYFVYNTENLANAGYEMTDVPEIPEADSGSVASGNVVGIDYYGASLLYETRVGVRFYFTVTGRIENYTFTDAAGNTYEPVSKSGMYYVEVMNINPNAYDDVIEMSVTDGANTLTVGYSPLRYISRKYYGNDAKLSTLVGAMYQYHKAAELFLNEHDDGPVYRGQEIVVGKSLSVMTEIGDYSQVIFDMIVPAEGGENEIGFALLDADWDYYGYFYLEKTGLENKYAGVSAELLDDGYWRVTINIDAITDAVRIHGDVGMIERVYINKHTTGGYIDNVQFVVREEPEYVDYAVEADGYVVRSGNVNHSVTDGCLQVTFAAASNRFEIQCGDQTAAANGTLQFKIKTDLTSIKLGGCNYSGGRKTTVTVDLTSSGDGFTVTDLGDGWVLVEVPMSVIGVSEYLAEFAIRFYDTNAAGTFILKDMNFVA